MTLLDPRGPLLRSLVITLLVTAGSTCTSGSVPVLLWADVPLAITRVNEQPYSPFSLTLPPSYLESLGSGELHGSNGIKWLETRMSGIG